MITRFSKVILTRTNGKQRILEYKTERPLTDDLLFSICSRLKINGPTWNEYSKDFEFDDNDWMGQEGWEPDTLEFLDDEGWYLEGFENEEEYKVTEEERQFYEQERGYSP